MLRMEAVFMDAIRRSIYAQLQDFVQVIRIQNIWGGMHNNVVD